LKAGPDTELPLKSMFKPIFLVIALR